MTPEQLQEFEEMKSFIESLKASTTIPFDVDGAFRQRLTGLSGLTVSAKVATSEDQAVDEGGAATYDVLGDPVGFLEIEIAGVTYYIPYYGA